MSAYFYIDKRNIAPYKIIPSKYYKANTITLILYTYINGVWQKQHAILWRMIYTLNLNSVSLVLSIREDERPRENITKPLSVVHVAGCERKRRTHVRGWGRQGKRRSKGARKGGYRKRILLRIT